MKTCSACKESKQENDFFKNRTRPDGLHSQCKACMRPYEKARVRVRTARYAERWRIRTKYGITHSDLDRMLEEQDYKCALCGQPETTGDGRGGVARLSIDHSHITGNVRALLCRRCNTGEGAIQTIERAKKLIAYYEKHGE